MKHISNCVKGIILLIVCVFYSMPTVSAQSASGLSIVPRKDYSLKPGQSLSDTLLVSNLNSKLSLSLTLKIIDFTYSNDSGVPKLLLSANAPQTTWSLKPYISIPNTVTVAPGGTSEIKMAINMPKNVGAGSYYSAIEYLVNSPSASNFSLSASGITLIFVNVLGNVKEHMNLVQLGAYQPDTTIVGGKYISIATTPPEEIGYSLQNTGNLAEAPAGSIVLQPMYGSHKIIISPANPNKQLALLGQTRLFTACISTINQNLVFNKTAIVNKVCQKNPDLMPGRYKVTLEVLYGQNGSDSQEIYGLGHFWYLPWWFIGVCAGAIIVIVLVIWRLVYLIRRAVYGPKKSTNKPI